MNMNDKITQIKQFVLNHWHTFGGGLAIGFAAALLLCWVL